MITQSTNANLIPGQISPRVNVSQYDKQSRTLSFSLYNGSQPFNIVSGMAVTIEGTKPDHTGFQYSMTSSVGSNVVSMSIEQQMTAVAGEVPCEIVVSSTGKRLCSANFILVVEPAALSDDTIISETELPLIEEAAELAENIAIYIAQIDADALKAEGYATGKQNGTDVGSGSPYYHNNAAYYAEQAAQSASVFVVDSALSDSSTNPVQNKVVKGALDQKQNILTFDDTPTQNSNNPVKSGGVYSSVSALNEALTDEVETRAKNGAHNLFRVDGHSTAGSDGQGLTWTDNGDDTFSVSGTPTGFKAFLVAMIGKLPIGTYTMSMGYKDMANITLNEFFLQKDGAQVRVLGSSTSDDITFTLTAEDDYDAIVIGSKRVSNGTACSGTIKPMIRLATDTDPTYQPYAMTNKELTDNKIDASQIAPIENGATASTSYEQGAYFIHNGKFCKAKTSIASGATFTKGTNYEETTVAAELIALA